MFSDLALSIVLSLKYLTSSSYLAPPKTLKHAPGPTSLKMKQNKNKSKTILNYTFFSNHSRLLFTAQLHKCSILIAHACNQLPPFHKMQKDTFNSLSYLNTNTIWPVFLSQNTLIPYKITILLFPLSSYFSGCFFLISLAGFSTYPLNDGVPN